LNKNLPQSKLTDIDALQGQLQEYKVAVDGVDEKISAVETELKLERTPVSDVEEEKKHIEKLEALKEQLEELKPEFQDALQSLLDWLAETRELVENQGPIAAADPNVMKAQMQEQKVRVSIRKSLLVSQDYLSILEPAGAK